MRGEGGVARAASHSSSSQTATISGASRACGTTYSRCLPSPAALRTGGGSPWEGSHQVSPYEGFAALRLSGELPPPLQTPVGQDVEVWLVDPHGYLVLHYPAGFDPNGLRRDLSRLIK